eukprot:14404-Heterococcus_DN1.PRE.1
MCLAKLGRHTAALQDYSTAFTLVAKEGSSGYACAALYCLQRGEVLHRPLAKVTDALSAFTQGLAYDKQATKQEHSINNNNSNSNGKQLRTTASYSTNSSGITVRARLLAARGACHLELSNPTDAMKDLQ